MAFAGGLLVQRTCEGAKQRDHAHPCSRCTALPTLAPRRYGFGSNKRICLYDTLIEQASQEQVVAVLAHELGHW